MNKIQSKTAIVLFNLGGPDSLAKVKPFLFSLFNDPAILTMPQPMRSLLAWFIATKRTSKAKAIYQQMGGKSPILEHTMAQGEALEKSLQANGLSECKVFVCMRHADPKSTVVTKKVKAYNPDKIILLPLYPQFSGTTTGSAFSDWDKSAKKISLQRPTARICCYPTEFNMVASHASLVRDSYWKAAEHGKPRVLFSAHGLPEKMIDKGDPYQYQIEKSVDAIVQILSIEELDYSICYQSRVGALPWIGPSSEEEIKRAGVDGLPLVVVPISFVCEHSETLIELDVDYRKLADSSGVPAYHRVPALGVDSHFIESLTGLCEQAIAGETVSNTNARICPKTCGQCICTQEVSYG